MFAPAVNVALESSSHPSDLQVLDVTGDGILDLVVVSEVTPAVWTHVGLGGTNFGPPVGTVIAPFAAFDLGVVGRRYPRIRALRQAPQVADHIAYGAVVGAVLAARRRARSAL